jgi:hypothetical protein
MVSNLLPPAYPIVSSPGYWRRKDISTLIHSWEAIHGLGEIPFPSLIYDVDD